MNEKKHEICRILKYFITFATVSEKRPVKGQHYCGNSSVGRASASQAEGHEFEPRLPLHLKIRHLDVNLNA